jgi:hypothetical protein
MPTERSPLVGEVDRGCHVVGVTDPCGRIIGFLDRSRYFFFQVAPQLYSCGLMDPVPDVLLLRKLYITYINSVRTSQEAQYISVV